MSAEEKKKRSNNNISNQMKFFLILWIISYRWGGKILTQYMPWSKYHRKDYNQICMFESQADYSIFQENPFKYNDDTRKNLEDKNLPFMNAIPLESQSKFPNPCEKIVNEIYDTNGYVLMLVQIIVFIVVYLPFHITMSVVKVKNKELQLLQDALNQNAKFLQVLLPKARPHSTIADNKIPLSLEPPCEEIKPPGEEIKLLGEEIHQSPRGESPRGESPRAGTVNKQQRKRRGRK